MAYWQETRHPGPSLLFLAPLLIAYEVGVVSLSSAKSLSLRNGADVWVREGLSAVGALLSNLISNVPAVMLFTRLIPQLPDPNASWLALAMSTTLAGNLTLLGSIANLIVLEGARRHGIRISFVDHLKVGLPVTIVTLAFGLWWLR